MVDWKRLEAAQAAKDLIEAEQCLLEAFERDVTPLLVAVREELGVPADPLAAFRQSGYMARIVKERS